MTTRKKAAKKTATKGKAKRKKVTGKTKTRKKAVKKAAKKTTKKTTSRKRTAVKASATTTAKKKTVKKKASRRKTVITLLADTPTEELWELYRKETNRTTGKPSPHLEELRNALIERHYPLVRYIAERLLQTLPKSIELDDLISAGLFGLMDAIRGFDASRGIKFKTYCSTRIRGAILDQLRSQDWVPRLVRSKASKLNEAIKTLEARYGRQATEIELAEQLGISVAELEKMVQEFRN